MPTLCLFVVLMGVAWRVEGTGLPPPAAPLLHPAPPPAPTAPAATAARPALQGGCGWRKVAGGGGRRPASRNGLPWDTGHHASTWCHPPAALLRHPRASSHSHLARRGWAAVAAMQQQENESHQIYSGCRQGRGSPLASDIRQSWDTEESPSSSQSKKFSEGVDVVKAR